MRMLLFLIILLLGCSPKKEEKFPKIEIQQEEYDIYSAFFNEYLNNLPDTVKHIQIFIVDSLGWSISDEYLDMMINVQREHLKNDTTLQEMTIDIIKKKAHKVHLENKFSVSTDKVAPFFIIRPAYMSYLCKTAYKPYKMRNNTNSKVMCIVFNNIYPESPGIFVLDRIGFNKDRTKAMLRSMLIVGPCFPEPFDRIYRKTDNKWIVEKRN